MPGDDVGLGHLSHSGPEKRGAGRSRKEPHLLLQFPLQFPAELKRLQGWEAHYLKWKQPSVVPGATVQACVQAPTTTDCPGNVRPTSLSVKCR